MWFLYVSLETGRVPHPWLARKLQPSLLQVLVGDEPNIFLEWIGQCPTSFLANNLLECYPKSENIEVRHSPRLPCINTDAFDMFNLNISNTSVEVGA